MQLDRFVSRARRSVVAVLGALALLIAPGAALAQPGGGGGTDRVRVIVELDHRGSATSVVRSMGSAADDVRTMKRLPVVVMEVPERAIAGLSRNPHVVDVSVDVAEQATLEDSLPVINADDVHDLGFVGGDATVAILDTGIDDDHPFFAGRIRAEYCSSSPADANEVSLCPDGTGEDDDADVDDNAACLDGTTNLCDHGSHVAGIAAGAAGTDPNAPGDGVGRGADIIAMQVFTRFNDAADCMPSAAPCVRTYASDQVAALDELADLNATNPSWNIAAANMSLGGGSFATNCDGDNQGRKASIDVLLAAGVATVIAAGNDSLDAAVGRPGCISTAFTVGSTTNTDTISGFSNQGTLLDVFAPGDWITSSVPDDGYANMGGTSMAAPHVAGALAVLHDAYPARSITDLMADLVTTGVDITYTSGGSSVTTPRINLLAALQRPNQPPTIAADAASVTVDEGQVATMTGTVSDDLTGVSLSASRGTVVAGAAGTWSWSQQTTDGPAQSGQVTITATDGMDEQSSVDFQVVVDNVAPALSGMSLTSAAEGGVVTLSATFTDPGWADAAYTAVVDWGTTQGELVSSSVQTTDAGAGAPDSGTVSATYRYGDDGTFPVSLTLRDKDGGSDVEAGSAVVTNLDPTAEIDTSGALVWNGQTIIVGQAGVPLDLAGDGTDPGSDDLTFAWDFGDGGTETTTWLNDVMVGPDPDPSPTVDPRDVTDETTRTYADACAFTLGLTVSDDDGGTAGDSAQVVVLGTSDDVRNHGYWQSEYRFTKNQDYTQAEKECLLTVVSVLSGVFEEDVDLTSITDAVRVLWTRNKPSATEIFDAQLLTAWVNVATGSLGLDETVDSDLDGVADTTVGAVLTDAEADRGVASDAVMLQWKNLLERINTTF